MTEDELKAALAADKTILGYMQGYRGQIQVCSGPALWDGEMRYEVHRDDYFLGSAYFMVPFRDLSDLEIDEIPVSA